MAPFASQVAMFIVLASFCCCEFVFNLVAHALILRLAMYNTITLSSIAFGHLWKRTQLTPLDKDRFMSFWYVVSMVSMVGFAVVNVVHSLQLLVHRHDADIHYPALVLAFGAIDFALKAVCLCFLDCGFDDTFNGYVGKTLFFLTASFVTVLVAVIRLLGFHTFVLWFDPAVSVLCCLILCLSILLVAFENVFVLLLAVPKAVNLNEIESRLQNTFSDTAIHRLHIWSEGRSFLNLSVHFRLKSAQLYERHVCALRLFFQSYGIHRIVLQPEFEDQVDVEPSGCLFDEDDLLYNDSIKL